MDLLYSTIGVLVFLGIAWVLWTAFLVLRGRH
jgi:hypothetical protein